MKLISNIIALFLMFATTLSICGQSFTLPWKDIINGRLNGGLDLYLNGQFRLGVAINRGEWSTEIYYRHAKLSWDYTYEYITESGLRLYGPVNYFDRVAKKEFQFSIPTTESGKAFYIYRKGVPFYSHTDQEEPGAIIWKEGEPGCFQFTFSAPKDYSKAWVVWNEGRTRESWGEERIQPDGSFTVDPAHLLKPDVIVIVETQRGLRFKRKFLRPGVGEIPQPEWLD